MTQCAPDRPGLSRPLLAAVAVLLASPSARAADDDARREFFESRIRPVLVDQCYSCHNSTGAAEGGLALDHRVSALRGGDGGPAIVPGSPPESRLVLAIRHELGDLRMPQDAPRLSNRVIADFEQWIADGAFDPRDRPPSADELAQLTAWEAVRDRRLKWWSFQPIRDRPAPQIADANWSDNPVDRFVRDRMDAAELSPARPADRRRLIRRLSFALTGLPPTPQQIDRFLSDDAPDAYERLVDRLLASRHFGERWARHWMDWFRYAETHGSEGDPAIPFAWRYRDYLIRALNDDVPYDQLIREHLAGDRLPNPRINDELGINESMIGTAQYRFVQHGFAPTDALDEQVRFTDNQIDVLSKAFLGLTVSCARCHHHKFDPISQQDFYALYGVMISSRPATMTVDTSARQELHRNELEDLKRQMREQLADRWLEAARLVPERLRSANGPWTQAVQHASDPTHPLHAWLQLHRLNGEGFNATWSRLRSEFQNSRERLRRRADAAAVWSADLSLGSDLARWYRHGAGLRDEHPARAGEFSVAPEGDQIVAGIFPAGVYTHRLSSKHNGVLSSRRIPLKSQQHLYLRVRGDGEARARYVVQHYPRRGTVYPLEILKDGRERWLHWDLSYWEGDDIHVEVGTAADLPVESTPDAVRSSFGVTRAVLLGADQVQRGLAPVDEAAEFVAPLFAAAEQSPPHDAASLAAHYEGALVACVIAWRDGKMTDEQARFLDAFVRENLLANRLTELPDVAGLVDTYRRLEAQIPIPTRAPGVLEADIVDQPLFVRGNHKQPAEHVERRFLEAFGARRYGDHHSGRLELAEDLVRSDNPLTARVIVNRVWHHLFGRGIVETPDNFGHLGAEPSHPELLDWLAVRFIEDGWSLKALIRRIVTTQTYRLDSAPSEDAAHRDPGNLWLSHAPLRRLEAEAIRDALLTAAGELDPSPFGPPGDSESNRRSVYLPIRRNEMVPLLAVFDQPTPFSTQGRRDVTNVPGQSLTLMNDPFVFRLAHRWAERLIHEAASASEEERIALMFIAALGRPPTPEETELARESVAAAARTGGAVGRTDSSIGAWQELALTLFNLKEFIYVR